MNLKKLSLISALLSSSLFVACSDGGGSIERTTPTGAHIAQFVDATVSGLDYETSSGIRGVTDENGYFAYFPEDTVVFKIGDLIVGSTIVKFNEGYVTPNDLIKDNSNSIDPKKIIQISALLVGLDVDKDPNNGIHIPEEIKKNFEGVVAKLDEEDLSTKKIYVDIDNDGIKEDLYEDVIKVYEDKAKAHYVGTLDLLLWVTLQNMQRNNTFYPLDKPNFTCSITNLNASLKTFSYECRDQTGIIVENKTLTIEPDIENGLLYLTEDDGTKNVLLEVDDELLCYITPENSKVCFAPRSNLTDPVTSEIDIFNYIFPKANKFEYAFSSTYGIPSAVVQKYYLTDQGYSVEVQYKYNPSLLSGSCLTDPNGIYNPSCYEPVYINVFKVTYENFEGNYFCFMYSESGGIEYTFDYQFPMGIKLNETYKTDDADITFLKLDTNLNLGLNNVRLIKNNNTSVFNVLVEKVESKDEITYQLFAENYGFMYLTNDLLTYSFSEEIANNFSFDIAGVTDFFFVMPKDTENYLYGELNIGDFSSDKLPDIISLINNLQFPSNVSTVCPQFTNYGNIIP